MTSFGPEVEPSTPYQVYERRSPDFFQESSSKAWEGSSGSFSIKSYLTVLLYKEHTQFLMKMQQTSSDLC
jgi:hypothetical protein